jgi:AcrR family transcriptional regulator
MPREYDSAQTKARILEAATAEFTEHGLAGGRVDRIAARAGANKQAIYAYFGSKRELFSAVIARGTGEFAKAIALDPADIGGALARIFDDNAMHPGRLRLLLWEALEHGPRPRSGEAERAKHNVDRVIAALGDAQHAGLISDEIEPAALLLLLGALTFWPLAFPQTTHTAMGDQQAIERIRAAVVRAGELLTAPITRERGPRTP